MPELKRPRHHIRAVLIAAGVLLAIIVLLFYPPIDRALGGFFARSADGATIAQFSYRVYRQSAKHHWDYVDSSRIPACLEQAIISVEDKRFVKHGGVDPIALIRASVGDAENVHVDHGGSTITLQLARIILGIPRRQPSFLAEVESKLRIARAALIVEHDYSKKKILELYLNSVYLGRGATGVAAGAKAYFNVALPQLNKAQCIYIAGLPNAPARFGADPSGAPAMGRYRHVIATMERNGYLSNEQAMALGDEQLFSRLSQN